MLCVHHYYPVGSGNIGDRLVAAAIRQSLVRHLGPCRFVDVAVNDRFGSAATSGLHGANLEASNREADLIVVGGSNLLEPRKPRRAANARGRHGRWGVLTDLASLRRIERPLLAIGMGTGSDFGQRIRPYIEPTISEIRAFADRAFAFAVRDEPTRRGLERLGIETICTGCPVAFWTDRPVQVADPNAPLIVSFPSTGLADQAAGRRFLANTASYLEWLRRIGEPYVIALHDERDFADAARWAPPGAVIFASTDLDAIVERYGNCRGVIGFRLHAALLALGLGKPIVPVGVDWRGIGFIETFGLDACSARADRWFQFAKLRRWTLELLAGSESLIAALATSKLRFHRRYEEFLNGAVHGLGNDKQAA